MSISVEKSASQGGASALFVLLLLSLITLLIGLTASPARANHEVCFGSPTDTGDSWANDSANSKVLSNSSNVINSKGGNDQIWAEGGNDLICGGPDWDDLYGKSGADHLRGNLGNDEIYAGPGDDLIKGHEADDYIEGELDDDDIYGGPSSSVASSSDESLHGDDGDDQVWDGTGGEWMLTGGLGIDTLWKCDNNHYFAPTGFNLVDEPDPDNCIDGD